MDPAGVIPRRVAEIREEQPPRDRRRATAQARQAARDAG